MHDYPCLGQTLCLVSELLHVLAHLHSTGTTKLHPSWPGVFENVRVLSPKGLPYEVLMGSDHCSPGRGCGPYQTTPLAEDLRQSVVVDGELAGEKLFLVLLTSTLQYTR